MALRNHYLTIFRHEFFSVCHADSFPQIVKMTNSVEIQTAPLPRTSGVWKVKTFGV
jgi:hypothetical protein